MARVYGQADAEIQQLDKAGIVIPNKISIKVF